MIQPKNLCAVCGQISQRPFLPCNRCMERMLPPPWETCSYCSMDLAGTDNPCPVCRESELHPVDGIISLGPWMGPWRIWLSLLKYGGDSRLAEWPGQMLVTAWKERWKGIPVVPVPPRPGKIRKEGRYAVALLARELKRNGIPVTSLLCRTDKTQQKTLSRAKRLEAFRLNFILKGKVTPGTEYVLLDDVCTTGATLAQSARVLKNAGSSKIFAMVVCKD